VPGEHGRDFQQMRPGPPVRGQLEAVRDTFVDFEESEQLSTTVAD